MIRPAFRAVNHFSDLSCPQKNLTAHHTSHHDEYVPLLLPPFAFFFWAAVAGLQLVAGRGQRPRAPSTSPVGPLRGGEGGSTSTATRSPHSTHGRSPRAGDADAAAAGVPGRARLLGHYRAGRPMCDAVAGRGRATSAPAVLWGRCSRRPAPASGPRRRRFFQRPGRRRSSPPGPSNLRSRMLLTRSLSLPLLLQS